MPFNKNLIVNNVFYIFIIAISFFYYAPCYIPYFDSDHGIHVLMSKDFEFARDYYYWGQNRLGSLLPLLSHLLHKVIPIHYLYVCSIVQYIFLLTGFIILSKPLKSILLKVALCAVIFLPVNEYNALILIGQPYAAQLFAGSLFVYLLHRLRKYLLSFGLFEKKHLLTTLGLILGASFFFYIGIWVSEFNAVLILLPVYYLLFDKPLRKRLFKDFNNKWILLSGAFSVACALAVFLIYSYLKKPFWAGDGYNSYFISNMVDVKNNFLFFSAKLKTTLLFGNAAVWENSYNWFILIISGFLIYPWFLKRKNVLTSNRHLIISLEIVCLCSVVMLFVSAWNLRSAFSPRYFTPVYVIYCYLILLWYDQPSFNKYLKLSAGALFVVFSIGYLYTVIISKEVPGPLKQYNEFRSLPRGTLMGGYWDVYKINAVATDNLQPLPFDNETVRNWNWRDIPLSETNFYFINENHDLPDSVYQYGILFNYSGTKYNCNNYDVLLYHKCSQ